MLQDLDSTVDLAFAPVGLADTFLAEQEYADQLRNEVAASEPVTFDPLGLYALEQDRDIAASLLNETLPTGWYFRLSHSAAVTRLSDGSFAKPECEWRACAAFGENTAPEQMLVTGSYATPAEAANELARLYRDSIAKPASEPAPTAPADSDETRVSAQPYGRFKAFAKLAGGRWVPAGYASYRDEASAWRAAADKLTKLRRDASRQTA